MALLDLVKQSFGPGTMQPHRVLVHLATLQLTGITRMCRTLYFRVDGGQVIVVSEPFDEESDWAEVPPNHALIAPASESVKIVPFDPTISSTSGAEPATVGRIIARR
ncbi:hypothetical protein [Bradyrhizobium glycinis]|uniref:hypothetical protein n=1 Tax=Bradyrhizobium glycinis TaxID=2751812 RepID=UPI0035DF1E90